MFFVLFFPTVFTMFSRFWNVNFNLINSLESLVGKLQFQVESYNVHLSHCLSFQLILIKQATNKGKPKFVIVST